MNSYRRVPASMLTSPRNGPPQVENALGLPPRNRTAQKALHMGDKVAPFQGGGTGSNPVGGMAAQVLTIGQFTRFSPDRSPTALHRHGTTLTALDRQIGSRLAPALRSGFRSRRTAAAFREAPAGALAARRLRLLLREGRSSLDLRSCSSSIAGSLALGPRRSRSCAGAVAASPRLSGCGGRSTIGKNTQPDASN